MGLSEWLALRGLEATALTCSIFHTPPTPSTSKLQFPDWKCASPLWGVTTDCWTSSFLRRNVGFQSTTPVRGGGCGGGSIFLPFRFQYCTTDTVANWWCSSSASVLIVSWWESFVPLLAERMILKFSITGFPGKRFLHFRKSSDGNNAPEANGKNSSDGRVN